MSQRRVRSSSSSSHAACPSIRRPNGQRPNGCAAREPALGVPRNTTRPGCTMAVALQQALDNESAETVAEQMHLRRIDARDHLAQRRHDVRHRLATRER